MHGNRERRKAENTGGYMVAKKVLAYPIAFYSSGSKK